MTKEQLKKKLLDLKIVVDNEYLDKYVEIIFNNLDTKKEKYKTQKHHIIPKCYYRHEKMNIDNSSNNLVNLYYKDHVLSHYFLFMCASTSWFKSFNYDSIRYVINSSYTEKDENIEKYISNMIELSDDIIKFRSEEARQRNLGNKNPMYGKKHSEHTKKLIANFQREYQLTHANPATRDDVKRKISQSLKGHIFTDDSKNKISLSIKNMIVMNKGKDEIRVHKKYEDEFKLKGYERGLSKSCKSKKASNRRVCVKYKEDIKQVYEHVLDAYLRAGFTIISKN